MKKLLYLFFVIPLLVGCGDNDDYKLPDQDTSINPVLGIWEEAKPSDDYKYVKTFTSDYHNKIDTYKDGKLLISNTYKYAVDREKIYYQTGDISFYKISNDTLYTSLAEIRDVRQDGITVSVKVD